MRIAILDFGTNTFNLLIAEKEGKRFKRIYSGKQAVKLGRGGIQKNMITKDAMERGYKAIQAHMHIISEFEASEIHAYATSAIRNAANGSAFVNEVKERFKFGINVIDGEEEAALIYAGIRESVDFGNEVAMILDIGGGSNEFIICDTSGILWKHSFELGMARIIEKFTISDPISNEEIKEIEAYYDASLSLLGEQTAIYKPTMLVGASGSFDTLAAIAGHRSCSNNRTESSMELPPELYNSIHRDLLASSAEQRLAMPGMEALRVEMIVPATIFINFVYNKFNLKSIRQSEYALKEGVMSRLLMNK